jgi:putative tryptophan/tyrosine transport system substrate-binding protein
MMRRREFIRLLGGAAAACPFAVRAQQAVRIPRIGMLLPTSAEIAAPFVDAFRQGLRDRGYIEKQNIAIEYRWTDGTLAYEAALELVGLKVDLILAWTTTMATAAKGATKTIPVVFVGVSDPIGNGLVTSLARPGGNLTGFSNIARDLSSKQIELLAEIVPRINTVALLVNLGNPGTRVTLSEAENASRALGVTALTLDTRSPDQIETAFAQLSTERVNGVVVLPEALFIAQRMKIAQLALTARLPTVFGRRENIDAGGLVSYGPSLRDDFRQAANFVDRILRGMAPSELPVEQPTRIEIVLNLKTAKALGLEVPPTLLARADEVIE